MGDKRDWHINLPKMTDAKIFQVVETNLLALAKQQGLKFDSVFKIMTYQKPNKR
jgi:hypothetical protein